MSMHARTPTNMMDAHFVHATMNSHLDILKVVHGTDQTE